MPVDAEGVIKFQLRHQAGALPDKFEVDDLIDSRQRLFEAGLIGRDGLRYGGLGYGNISCRVGVTARFLITGSQTGHLATLQRQHIALVTEYQRQSNTLTSQGLARPSSESSTHAFFYSLSSDIGAVIHVHSPKLWRYAAVAGLPATDESTPYGSPELLAEIESLWRQQRFAPLPVLAMLGHVDGIISFGSSLTEAEATLWNLSQMAPPVS